MDAVCDTGFAVLQRSSIGPARIPYFLPSIDNAPGPGWESQLCRNWREKNPT